MNCPKCNNLIPDNSLYCPVCGEPLTQPDSTNVNGLPPVIAALHKMLSSQRLLVLAILFTVAAGAQLMNGGGLPVFEILLTISMWLLYSSNKKGNIMGYATPLKMISGTVFANTIIFWITGGIFAVSGLIVALSGSAAKEFLDLAINIGELSMDEIALFESYGDVVATVAGIAIVITSAVLFLVNIFIYKRIHNFTKSVLLTFQTGVNQIVRLGLTKNVMLVFGILTAISALSNVGNFMAFVANAALAAAEIIVYVMLSDFEKDIANT